MCECQFYSSAMKRKPNYFANICGIYSIVVEKKKNDFFSRSCLQGLPQSVICTIDSMDTLLDSTLLIYQDCNVA